MVSKKEKERQENRKAGRVLYDLPPELKKAVADLANELGVPHSQVATLLLEQGLDALKNSGLDLTEFLIPSRTPLFKYNLDMDRLRQSKKK